MQSCEIDAVNHPGYDQYGIINNDIIWPLEEIEYFKNIFFIHGIDNENHIKLHLAFKNHSNV